MQSIMSSEVLQKMMKTTTKRNFCPYLQKPFEECYCVKMNSQDIEKAVYFCTTDFKMCEIYKGFKLNGKKLSPKFNSFL